MCGIAGILNQRGGGVELGLLQAMTDYLKHRGPDGKGLYYDDYIGLGHRRLAIIDLKTGAQPMSDASGRFHITYNGEVYNFRQLRQLLESKGHSFRTSSDTEVVLHSYIEFGERCPEKLNGMFAFAIWDKSERKLFLARDRLGIKPLYYCWVNGDFIFASEIKSLLLHPELSAEPNLNTIGFYLAHYQNVMGEETLFKGIFSLEPGCSLTIENGVAHLRKYWIFPMVPENEKEDKGEAYYIQGVRELVSKAVERQLVSDVPLGAYLSGGLDSSIIVALMTLQTKRPVKTYAIGFPEEGFNEFRYSDQVASIWGADHTQITIEEEDYFKTILELIRFKDSPLSVPNEVPLYLMSKVLKERITVTISGEGSDELFGGYGGIMRSPFDYLRSLPNSIVPANQRRLLNKALMRLYGKTEFASELDHFLSVYCWMKSGELSVIFKPEVLEDSKNFISTRNFWQCQFSKLHSLDLYNKYLCLMETVHLPGLLGRLDTTTMAVGVEGRVPFTDTELLEFAANIPHRYKVHWNSPMYEDMCARLHSFEISEVMDTTKYILKRSFVDKVPPDVLFRKKYSFPVPLERWFSNGLLGEFLSEVEGPLPDYLDKKGLIEWVTTSNYPDKPLKIWMLLNLILWHKEYFTGIFEKLSLEENGQHILALK